MVNAVNVIHIALYRVCVYQHTPIEVYRGYDYKTAYKLFFEFAAMYDVDLFVGSQLAEMSYEKTLV